MEAILEAIRMIISISFAGIFYSITHQRKWYHEFTQPEVWIFTIVALFTKFVILWPTQLCIAISFIATFGFMVYNETKNEGEDLNVH